MHSLIYVSSATKPFTGAELSELLGPWRRNNEQVGLTGMLLYKEGSFMQVLEGEEKPLRELFAKIERDPRHHSVVVILEDSTNEREFSHWSMGFSNLDLPEASRVPGYSEFMNTPLTAEVFAANPSQAQWLLRVFKGA